MRVAGIDPGTGSNSALGLVVFDTETREIAACTEIWADVSKQPTYDRIRSLARQAGELFNLPGNASSFTFIEYFVMRGKGGETLSRMVGALITKVPEGSSFIEVQNSTVKKLVGGHGAASKELVAEGVLEYFADNEESFTLISELIHGENWDALDAFAIAIAGVIRQNELVEEGVSDG